MKYTFSRPEFDLRTWSEITRSFEDTLQYCEEILYHPFAETDGCPSEKQRYSVSHVQNPY